MKIIRNISIHFLPNWKVLFLWEDSLTENVLQRWQQELKLKIKDTFFYIQGSCFLIVFNFFSLFWSHSTTLANWVRFVQASNCLSLIWNMLSSLSSTLGCWWCWKPFPLSRDDILILLDIHLLLDIHILILLDIHRPSAGHSPPPCWVPADSYLKVLARKSSQWHGLQ